jgi:hypothetical protein
MSDQHPHEFSKDGHAFLANQPARANDDDGHENITYQQAPTIDNFLASFNPFNLPLSSYDNYDNRGILVNYQHAFQPLGFDPHYHMQAYSGAHPSSINAPTGFYNPPVPEQPWIDEIHRSYTPVGGETFEWNPSDARSYGWHTGAPFTNPAEQVVNANTPTTHPVDQYFPLETAASEASIARRFVPETITRIPLQQVLSTRPASVALKVRNEKFKKDITTLLYDKADHNGHRAMRVSKTKKAEKPDNTMKQEACWRCKRYRKAVSPWFVVSIFFG